MSRHQKLLQRFLTKPQDFTYDELTRLLQGFGYRELKGGKTSGSRVAFFHQGQRGLIRLHRPHSEKALKRYQLDDVEWELKLKGFI